MSILDLKCSGCASRLIHDPINENFKCNACGNTYNIDQISLNDSIEKYKCRNCGAEITIDENEVSTKCDYCENTAIIKSKLSNEYKPDYILFFKTTKEMIETEFKKLTKESNEIDADFVKNMKIKKIKPMYVPFFTYSFDMSASVLLTEIIDNKYNTRRKKASIKLDQVPLDGSIELDDDTMMSLCPFDLSKKVKYNHAYLSGHRAEIYDEAKERINEKVKAKTETTLINYFTKENISCIIENCKIKNKKIEYILLPIWIIEVVHKGEKHKFYMNGQTKEIVGKTNYNNTTVLFFIGLIACILFIQLLFPYLDTKGMLECILLFIPIIIVLIIFIFKPKKLVNMQFDFHELENQAIVKEEQNN